nr:phage morphogeneis protein [uncultured bacterium]
MARSTDANFAAQGRPQWRDLAPSTKRSRARKGTWPGMILQVSAAGLASSVHSFATSTSAGVGTNKIYAAIQQLGGKVRQAARSQKLYFSQDKDGIVGNRFVKKSRSNFSQETSIGAREIVIRARPFLQLVPAEVAKIEAAAMRFMIGN